MKGFIKLNNPDLKDLLIEVLQKYFGHSRVSIENAIEKKLIPILKQLKDNTSLYIETNYIDKVYRDSYYLYYSSKAKAYKKDSIRISFFEDETNILAKGKVDYNNIDNLQKSYRGFLIIRPTLPQIIGRNAISPQLYKESKFVICDVNIPTTVDGMKVSVRAFPSSSQDKETITCAETTIWSLMEYFGNKYAEYSPTSPSEIIKILKNALVERQLPSNGLSADHLAYVLKDFCFGPKLYHKDCFSDLHNILSCYVESGIPIIVTLSNEQNIDNKLDPNIIRHAVLCIGRETLTEELIDKGFLEKTDSLKTKNGPIHILDFDNIVKQYVFIDDNCPPYALDFLETPTKRYEDALWKECKIVQIIAPLYNKIYLDAFLVKRYVDELLCEYFFKHLITCTISKRVYLCSTRNYRNYVAKSNMSEEMKLSISDLYLPKFIWVVEISDKTNIKAGKATSLIMLDATGIQTSDYEPLIAIYTNNTIYAIDSSTNEVTQDRIIINGFDSYYNLK